MKDTPMHRRFDIHVKKGQDELLRGTLEANPAMNYPDLAELLLQMESVLNRELDVRVHITDSV